MLQVHTSSLVRQASLPLRMPVGLPALAGVSVALLALLLLQAGGDAWIADAVVRMEGGRYAWRDAPWLSKGLHEGGRQAVIATWLALLAWWALLRVGGTRTVLRRRLGCVLLAVLVCTTVVALWKSVSGVDCPWDLGRYGGRNAWHPLWQAGTGHCFPGGHAGAGYAWMALGPAARGLDARLRSAGWAIGIGSGLVFGIAQQLRGAHFLSHDLAAALLCWAVAQAMARVCLPEVAR